VTYSYCSPLKLKYLKIDLNVIYVHQSRKNIGIERKCACPLIQFNDVIYEDNCKAIFLVKRVKLALYSGEAGHSRKEKSE